MTERDDLQALDRVIKERIAKGENRHDEATDEEAADEKLADAFSLLRQETAKQGAKIDIAAKVTARVRQSQRRGVLIPMRRWIPAAAAAMVVLFLGQQALWAKNIEISAPGGAHIWTGKSWESVKGELEVGTPLRLKSELHPVSVSAPGWSGHLASQSVIGIADEQTLSLESGQLQITAEDPISLGIGAIHATVQGEIAAGANGESAMTNKGRVKAAGSGVVVIVAIYSGYVLFSSEAKSMRIDAPGGAVVDGSGEITRTGLHSAESRLANGRSETKGLGRLVGLTKAVADMEEGPTGGFWDEDAQTVRFSLAGEVFDAQTGQPIEDFDVDLSGLSIRSFDAPQDRSVHISDAQDGQFRLSGLGLGQWSLLVRAAGYAPSRQEVSLDAVTADPYLVVPLSQGGRVSGVVTDWRGQGLQQATVRLGDCGGNGKEQAHCPTATTDAKGAFVLTGAPQERPFSLQAHHPRYGFADRHNLQLGEGETKHVTLQLSGILKVKGRVYQGKQREPVVGVEIQSQENSTRTGEGGYYEMLIPLARRPEVQVVTGTQTHPVRFGSYPKNRSVEPVQWVDADTHVAELEKDFLLAQETAVLTGRISYADNTPAAEAKVEISNHLGWAQREHQTFPEQTVTDADGTYRIEGIPAHAGYILRVMQGDEDRRLGTVIIDEPREVVADFTIGGGTIRGRFVDSHSGEPFPLSQDSCGRFGAMSQRDDAIYGARCLDDGSFEFRDMAAGAYRLGLIGPEKLRVDAQFEEQVVELTGSMLDGLEIPIKGSQSVTWTARITHDSGRFVPGVMLRYHYSRGGSRTSSLNLADDGTAKFTLTTDQSQVFFDAPGYAPTEMLLADRDPSEVIDVKMTLTREP